MIPQTKPGSDQVLLYVCVNCMSEPFPLSMVTTMEKENNARIIFLPCSGKTDPVMLLRPLEGKFVRVGVTACMPEVCRNLEGSARAALRVKAAGSLVSEAGLTGERIRYFTASTQDDVKAAIVQLREELSEISVPPEKLKGREK